MITKLWEMPASATTLIRGPEFTVLPQRRCKIAFSIEGDDGEEQWIALLFNDVEAFRATYLTSLGAIDTTLRSAAYETLVVVSESPWLTSITSAHSRYCRSADRVCEALRHLVMHFDDGPCFEIICTSFQPESECAVQ